MRVTLNEVQRLCQKAAEGVGVPAGLDIETAQATAWLLAHGFPVLSSLAVALENLDEHACRFDGAALSSNILDAAAKAGPLIAPGLIDLLLARAGQGLSIHHLEAPLYLLPSAVRYADQGKSFWFECRPADGNRFVLDIGPASTTIYGSADCKSLTSSTRFAVQCEAADSVQADVSGLAVRIDQTALNNAETRSLAAGLEADPEAWRRLQALAQKVLVPASKASRHGAGAGSSDND